MKSTVDQRLLRPCEVQKLLAVSEATLQRMRKDGTIKAVSVGGMTRYPVSEVEKLIGGGERKS